MVTIEFTTLVKDIIKSSGKLAMQYGEEYSCSEHLLLAIIDESLKQTNKSEQILKIFKRFKLDVFALIEDVEATFDHDKPRLYLDQVPLSSSHKQITMQL
jgi:ATP-dependent Clp protease ATP-binding subunit ClpA